MGQHVIKMPDIGEGIAEVEVIAWKVAVGDSVDEDQVVAEVMTDKAMVEIPSPVAGTVLSLGSAPGEMMAVGSELIRLEVEGEGNAAAIATEAAAPPPASPAPVSEPAPTPEPKPAARAEATAPAPAPGERPLASPAVRRRAWDLGIELRFVPPTGAGGRITHADLDAYAARAGQTGSGRSSGSGYARRSGETQIPVIGLRRRIAQK